jgi:hypothetical protein
MLARTTFCPAVFLLLGIFLAPPPLLGAPAPFQDRARFTGVGDGSSGFINDFEFLLKHTELEELTFDFNDDDVLFGNTLGSSVDVEDIERDQLMLRYRPGNETVGGVFGIFFEKWDLDDRLVEEVDIFGVNLGVNGTPRFLKRPVSPIVDYGFDLSVHIGNGDDFFDDLVYAEVALQAGVGVDVYGVQATVGAMNSTIVGVFTLEQQIENATGLEGEVLAGNNLAGYLRVGYRGRDAPVVARIQALIGQITGVVASVGLRF